MKYKILFMILVLVLLIGCTRDISEIKNEEHIGETVTLKGTVENTVKVGGLSGYTLVENDGDKIAVSTEDLPAEGNKIKVKGTVERNILIGYYIQVE